MNFKFFIRLHFWFVNVEEINRKDREELRKVHKDFFLISQSRRVAKYYLKLMKEKNFATLRENLLARKKLLKNYSNKKIPPSISEAQTCPLSSTANPFTLELPRLICLMISNLAASTIITSPFRLPI